MTRSRNTTIVARDAQVLDAGTSDLACSAGRSFRAVATIAHRRPMTAAAASSPRKTSVTT